MPRARNRFERANQALQWMRDSWPAGRPVRLVWRKEIVEKGSDGEPIPCHGRAHRDGRSIVLELSLRLCRTWETTTRTLMHEYAHAVLWGPASIEFDERVDDHGAAFRALESEINHTWDYDGGSELASEYEVDL